MDKKVIFIVVALLAAGGITAWHVFHTPSTPQRSHVEAPASTADRTAGFAAEVLELVKTDRQLKKFKAVCDMPNDSELSLFVQAMKETELNGEAKKVTSTVARPSIYNVYFDTVDGRTCQFVINGSDPDNLKFRGFYLMNRK